MRFWHPAVLALAIPLVAGAQVPEELRHWVDAQKDMPDMRVPFTMTRILPTLKEPAVSAGRFWRLKDGRFRMEIGQPASSAFVFDGKDLHAWESGRVWEKVPPNHSSARMWTMFLHQERLRVEELTRDFTPTVIHQPAGVHLIQLQPKSSALRRRLTQIDLQVASDGKRLLQMRMVQADGSQITFAFSPPQTLDKDQIQGVRFGPDAG